MPAGGKRKKKVIKDTTIVEIFGIRDKLLAGVTDEKEKEKIHMACQGIFKCPKEAKDADKKKCFDAVKKKLEALGGKFGKGDAFGGGKRRRSRSRSRSRSKSQGKSKSRSRSRSRSRGKK